MAVADHIERAKRLIAGRDYREAVRTCRRALLAHPESIEVRLLLGGGLLAMERFDEVRTEMLAVLRSAPKEAKAYRLLGEAYLYDGRPDRAIESFHKALEIDPSDSESLQLLNDATMEEPTATMDKVVPGASADITRESELPGFDLGEHTDPTQRALPEAMFAKRKQESAPSPVQTMLGAGSLPAPGKLPSGISGLAGEKTAAAAQKPSTQNYGMPSRPVPSRPAAPSSPSRPAPPSRKGRPSVGPSRSVPPPPPPSRRPSARPAGAKPSPTVPPPSRRGPSLPVGPEKPVFSKTLLGSPAPSSSAAAPPSRRVPDEVLPPFDTSGGDTMDTWNTADALLTGELDAMERELHGKPDTSDFEELPTEVREPETSIERIEKFPVASEPTVMEDVSDLEPFSDRDTNQRDDDPLWIAPSNAPVPPPSTPSLTMPPRVKRRAPRTSRTKRWLLGGLALFLLFGLGFGVTAWWRLRSRAQDTQQAVLAVTKNGGVANYDRALGLLSKQDQKGPYARLLAARAFAAGDVPAEPLKRAMSQIDSASADHAIAEAYTALLQDKPEAALRSVEGFATDAEAQYISSVAHLELGQWDEARKSARSAAHVVQDAARYEAQRVITETITGSTDARAVPNIEHTSLQTAMLVLRYFHGEKNLVAPAQALIQQRLTMADQGWLRWLLLRLSIDRNDTKTANRLAQALIAPDAVSQKILKHAPSPLRLLMGTAMLDVGRSKDASNLFATLSSGVRARPEAQSPQVHLLLLEGRPDDARARLAELPKSTVDTELLRARVEVADQKFAQALHFLKKPLNENRTRGEAMILAGRAYAGLGRWKEAIDSLEPIWKLRKKHPIVTRDLVDSLIASGEMERAERVMRGFEKAGGDPSVTAAAYVRLSLSTGDFGKAEAAASKLAANDAKTIALKARVFRQVGSLVKANEVFTKVKPTFLSDSEVLRERVLVALRLQDFALAQKLSKQLGDRTAAAKQVAAMVEVVGGGGQNVIKGLGAVKDSTDADLHAYLGHALANAERDRESADAYKKALVIQPGHPEAALGLGLLAMRAANFKKATMRLATARSSSAKQDLGKKFTARLLAVEARLEYERGSFKRADKLVAQALVADNRCGLAHMIRAVLAEERGKRSSAMLEKATQGTFVQPEAFARLAMVSKSKSCDLAAQYLEAAPKGYDANEMRKVTNRCK